MPPRVGLLFDSNPTLCEAARPLFSEGLVAALEYGIDEGWDPPPPDPRAPRGAPQPHGRAPAPYVERLLDLYAAEGALYGHGMWLSLLTTPGQPFQEAWLADLAQACHRRPYRHVSEHWGFRAARGVPRSTILPVPASAAAISVARQRLLRLREAAGVPVGLEVLASTLGAADARAQGPLLGAALTGDDFLLLDVPNVMTQAHHHGLDARRLLRSYPLQRVRELHVSNGWGRSAEAPQEAPLLRLVREALALCPACEVVIFELRGSLRTPEECAAYQADYRALCELVADCAALGPQAADELAPMPLETGAAHAEEAAAIDEDSLATYQSVLLGALLEEPDGAAAQRRARRSLGEPLAPYIDAWEPRLVALLAQLAREEAA